MEKRLCEGLNRKGKPCRADAMPGRPYCAYHDPDLSPAERARRISPKWAAVSEAQASGALDRTQFAELREDHLERERQVAERLREDLERERRARQSRDS